MAFEYKNGTTGMKKNLAALAERVALFVEDKLYENKIEIKIHCYTFTSCPREAISNVRGIYTFCRPQTKMFNRVVCFMFAHSFLLLVFLLMLR